MLPDPCLIFCQSETLSFPSKNLDVSRGEVTSNCFPLINHLTERLSDNCFIMLFPGLVTVIMSFVSYRKSPNDTSFISFV